MPGIRAAGPRRRWHAVRLVQAGHSGTNGFYRAGLAGSVEAISADLTACRTITERALTR